jgi:sec-independent protein translocase protein TatB
MFDIGFSEILVIAGLSLVVLGPDKLPRVVKTVGRWAGRARAMARQFSDQLAAEADNLKVDLDSKAASASTPPGTGAPPGNVDSAAAAAAAAAPTPPPEFTGAPIDAPSEAVATAEPLPSAQPVEEPQYPSANGSGHADLSQADVAAGGEAPYDPANPPIPKPDQKDPPA